MKKVLLVVIVVILAQALKAQTKIQGIVKDGRNHPIQGVSISVKDSYDGATTDSLGRFSFQTVEKGDQLIVASSIGYNSYEQKVTLATDAVSLNIVLKEKLDELKAMQVEAG